MMRGKKSNILKSVFIPCAYCELGSRVRSDRVSPVYKKARNTGLLVLNCKVLRQNVVESLY